ncbi:hypothetical protein PENSPDRAFT_756837 [Peniophora sp. CONT]|nr:hypothetical protein PENSPDRAFT_756837 [Peniophora sp. CONT]
MAIDGPLPVISFRIVPGASDYLKINGLNDQQPRSYGFNDGQDWERPEHYVRHVDVPEAELATQVEYDMDEQDNEWLSAVNSERRVAQLTLVKPEAFEVIMDRLEKEHFDLQKAAGGGREAEMAGAEDAQCAVCEDSEGENTNAIVFCDGCNLAVHQDCYGVPYIPEGQWLCRKCALSPEVPVSCALCPAEGGAFKQDNRGEWVHLLCAIWIPETGVMNDVFMEPITGTDRIPRQRWKLKCGLCDDPEGACIQCNNRSCYFAFHVTCARRCKLLMPMKAAVPGMDAPQLQAFCEKHIPPERVQPRLEALAADAEKAAALARDPKAAKAARAHAKGYAPRAPLVPAIVVRRVERYIDKIKLRKPNELVELVARYWSLKREARRGAPLLRRLHLEPSSAGARAMDEQERTKKLERTKSLRADLQLLSELTIQTIHRERFKRDMALTQHTTLSTLLFPHAAHMRLVFERIRSHDKQDVFKHPVNKNEVPGYYEVIKRPMCWGWIEARLEGFEYWDLEDFKSDVMLVLDNARTFNPSSHAVHKLATRIRNQAIPLLAELDRFKTSAPGEVAPLESYGKDEAEEKGEEGEKVTAKEKEGEEVEKDVPMEVDGEKRVEEMGEGSAKDAGVTTAEKDAEEGAKAVEGVTDGEVVGKDTQAADGGAAGAGEAEAEVPMDVDTATAEKSNGTDTEEAGIKDPTMNGDSATDPGADVNSVAEPDVGGGGDAQQLSVDDPTGVPAGVQPSEGGTSLEAAPVDRARSIVEETPVPASVKELTPLAPASPNQDALTVEDSAVPAQDGDAAPAKDDTATPAADEEVAPVEAEVSKDVEMQVENDVEVQQKGDEPKEAQMTTSPAPIAQEEPTDAAPAPEDANTQDNDKEKEPELAKDPKHVLGDLEPPLALLLLLRSAAVAEEAPVRVRGAPLEALFSFEMPVEKPRPTPAPAPAPPATNKRNRKKATQPRVRRTNTPQQAEAGPSRLPATPPPHTITPAGTPGATATTPGTTTSTRHRAPPNRLLPGLGSTTGSVVESVTDHESFLRFNVGWILPDSQRTRTRKPPPNPVPQPLTGKRKRDGKDGAGSVGASTPSVGGRAELPGPGTPGPAPAPAPVQPGQAPMEVDGHTRTRDMEEELAAQMLVQLRGPPPPAPHHAAPHPPPQIERQIQPPQTTAAAPTPLHLQLAAPLQLSAPSQLGTPRPLRGPGVRGPSPLVYTTPQPDAFELRPIDEHAAQRWREQIEQARMSSETGSGPSESLRGPSTARAMSESVRAVSVAGRGLSEVPLRAGTAPHMNGESAMGNAAGTWQDVDGEWRMVAVSPPPPPPPPSPPPQDEHAPMDIDEADLASAQESQPVPASEAQQTPDAEDEANAPLDKEAKAEALDAAEALGDVDAEEDAEDDEESTATPPPPPLKDNERLTHSPGGTRIVLSVDSPAIRRAQQMARRAKAREAAAAEADELPTRTRAARSSTVQRRDKGKGKARKRDRNARNERAGMVLKRPEPESEPEDEDEDGEAGPAPREESARSTVEDKPVAGLSSDLSDLSDLDSADEGENRAGEDEGENRAGEDEGEGRAGEDEGDKDTGTGIEQTEQAGASLATMKAGHGVVDSSNGIPENTLVWAKMGSYPYYPARIINPDSDVVPNSVHRSYRTTRKKRGQSKWQLVQFFDEGNDWGTIHPVRLRYMFRFPEIDAAMLKDAKGIHRDSVHKAFERVSSMREELEGQIERDG